MPSKRRWGEWPKRVSQELNGVAGVAGLSGVAVSAGGLTFLAGATATALTGVGAVALLGAVGYAAYKAIPRPMQRPEDMVGKIIGIDELDNVDPPIKTVSFIGASQAGKTTLKNRLAFDFSPIDRTQSLSAYVVSLQTVPPSYVAILDGDGDKHAQQFKLAEKCDFLCIVGDHNKSDVTTAINSSRLAEHQAFLKQVRHHLDLSRAGQKLWVQILINKHDLWSSESQDKQTTLRQFYAAEAETMRQGKYASNVDCRIHSNDDANDVARFMEQLKRSAIG